MLSDGLGGFFFVCTQERIDSRLVAGPLCLEPIEYLGVDSQGNDRLGRNGLETAPHDSANDMLGRGLSASCAHVEHIGALLFVVLAIREPDSLVAVAFVEAPSSGVLLECVQVNRLR